MKKKKPNTLKQTIKKMEKSGIHVASLTFYDFSEVTKDNPNPRKIVVIPEKEVEN